LLREWMPQDLKVEIEGPIQRDAVVRPHFFASVVGEAHAGKWLEKRKMTGYGS
jgi:hypothetical protein